MFNLINKVTMPKVNYYIGVAEIEVSSRSVRLQDIRPGITIDRGAEVQYLRPAKSFGKAFNIINKYRSVVSVNRATETIYIKEYFVMSERVEFGDYANADIQIISQF